jgi:hypothetical protein
MCLYTPIVTHDIQYLKVQISERWQEMFSLTVLNNRQIERKENLAYIMCMDNV